MKHQNIVRDYEHSFLFYFSFPPEHQMFFQGRVYLEFLFFAVSVVRKEMFKISSWVP